MKFKASVVLTLRDIKYELGTRRRTHKGQTFNTRSERQIDNGSQKRYSKCNKLSRLVKQKGHLKLSSAQHSTGHHSFKATVASAQQNECTTL